MHRVVASWDRQTAHQRLVASLDRALALAASHRVVVSWDRALAAPHRAVVSWDRALAAPHRVDRALAAVHRAVDRDSDGAPKIINCVFLFSLLRLYPL